MLVVNVAGARLRWLCYKNGVRGWFERSSTDNGIENKQHKLVTRKTGTPVFFTDPYSSWQKGGVENANKMLRRYFPKGTNFSTITQREVDAVLWTINNKPRQSLGFKSAIQCAREKGLLLDGVSY